MGTGPYKFDHLIVESGQIKGVVLAVNDDYYWPKPFIQQVVFRYYPDSQSAFDAYDRVRCWASASIDADVLPQALRGSPALGLYQPPSGDEHGSAQYQEPGRPFLDNANVRRALLLGLNRNFIVSSFLQGQAIVADGPILPGSWAYYDGVERLSYDPEGGGAAAQGRGIRHSGIGGTVRAKENVALDFVLIHPDDALHTQIAQAIQQQWAQIGVQVNLQAVPYDQIIPTYLGPRAYQAALVDLNLARTPDPDPYPFWHQAEATGGQNYSQWDNRAASEYLEQARTETDFTVRTRLYRNFQVIFEKELPSLPLYLPGVQLWRRRASAGCADCAALRHE